MRYLTLIPIVFCFAMAALAAGTFTNPRAVEQALDNNPAAARVALEETLTQYQINEFETAIVPPPTLEQQEADLMTARALLSKTTDDAEKSAAIAAIDKKLATLEAQKPKDKEAKGAK